MGVVIAFFPFGFAASFTRDGGVFGICLIITDKGVSCLVIKCF